MADEDMKQKFLCVEELQLINNLIELDIKDREGMIEAIQSIVISEDVKDGMEDMLLRINKRVIEALESFSYEDVARMVSSYPISNDDIGKFAY
nr:hypothetical protein [Sedimentibacter sp.]